MNQPIKPHHSYRIPLPGLGALAVAGAAVFLAYAHWVERAWVSLDRYTVVVDRSGLPPEGLTILHLSDFHFRATDPAQAVRLNRLTKQLSGQKYDIVALTGDLIHDEKGLPTALAFLHTLQPRLAMFTVPGNRDYWQSSFLAVFGTPAEKAGLSVGGKLRLLARKSIRALRTFARNERAALGMVRNDVVAMHARLAAQNVTPLVNRAVHIQQADRNFWVAGVDDLTQGKPDLDTALAAVPPDAMLILLAHNPDAWLDPLTGRADLILSGHTHGGQIRFPGVGALYRQGTHVGRRRAAGWFRNERTHLFITRGMGESFPFRFGARPQAALIRLIPPQSTGGQL